MAKKKKIQQKKTIDNLNGRLEKVFAQFDEVQKDWGEERLDTIKFHYSMLFGWWLLDEDGKDDATKINNLCSAEGVDFLDFVSATRKGLVDILAGKREFDFDDVSEYVGDKEMRKWYYKVDGIAIQKHNKVLAEYSLDLIDYMFASIMEENGVLVGFEKVKQED